MTVAKNGLTVCAIIVAVLQQCTASELCVTVHDMTRAALIDTTVTYINLSGKAEAAQALTGPDGIACHSGLREGKYRVDIWKPGFLHASFQPIPVRPEAPARLFVLLPFGEIREGGVGPDALVSGTLTSREEPVADARICVFNAHSKKPIICVDTSEMGEYALSLSPGEYRVEIVKGERKSRPMALSLPGPGSFRNRLNPSWIE